MKEKDLIKLGFKDTSFEEEGEKFTEFTLKSENFTIQVSGVNLVEIYVARSYSWLTVSNCKTIKDLKDLIKLFSKE